MEYKNLVGGIRIPQIGLGTFDLKADAIRSAIELGYRLFDTAWQYQNEKEVGAAIRESGIGRENVQITTKLWTDDIRAGRVREELEDSLRNLGTDYVDLYLIHWPALGFEAAWDIMAQLKEEGKVRAIGVCNFEEHHFRELEKSSGLVPVLNQIEIHPYFQNDTLIQFCIRHDIVPQAWCPLGGSYSKLVNDAALAPLAQKYGKTPAQIILRWHLQRDVCIIPRSSNRQRQQDNLAIEDFCLSTEDMELIQKMDTGRRIGADPNHFNF